MAMYMRKRVTMADIAARMHKLRLGDPIPQYVNESDEDDDDHEPTPARRQPFPFFSLPYELRLRIFELVLLQPKTIDLDPQNYRSIRPLLSLFLVSHRMHDEATRVFYGRNTFRVLPIHGRFIHTKKPLLMRLSARNLGLVTQLELRVGPCWTKPPKGWVIDKRLHLHDAVKARVLKVFVECDPASDPIFEGFRVGEDFYTMFCTGLVRDLFDQVGSLERVEFDAYPGITKSSPLLQALVQEAKGRGKRIEWGPERGWDKIVEETLMSVFESLALGTANGLQRVEAVVAGVA